MTAKTQSVHNRSAFGCIAAKAPFSRFNAKPFVKSIKTLDTHFFDDPTNFV